ncbi:MAG: GNAT family N-acetyltransferase [Myxococcota bacterium]
MSSEIEVNREAGSKPSPDRVRLQTKRLELRPHRAEDFESVCGLWTHPKIVARFGGEPRPRMEIWRRMLAYRGHWSLFGWGYWTVRECGSGDFVGELGFNDFRRGIAELEGSPEAGWSLNPEFHGRGYAREAMEAALAWFTHEHGVSRTVCMIGSDNDPSLKLAQRLAYVPFGTGEYQESEVVFLERVVSDG